MVTKEKRTKKKGQEPMAAAEAAAEELREITWGPFTQAQHEELYSFLIDVVRRISPRTPVAVCHGSADTWQALSGAMAMTPGNYVCNCGPTSAPGGPLYDELCGVSGPGGAGPMPVSTALRGR